MYAIRSDYGPVDTDAAIAHEYGVMAHWTDGHVIEYVAQRPTIVTNFGDDLGESYNFV